MNSDIPQENNYNKIKNENEIKSKYDSINSWLDDENSKYSSETKNNKNSNINPILNNNNTSEINETSKNDILSNINKLLEENEKKDQY